MAFLVKFKSVVDTYTLNTMLDRSILHGKAKVCVSSKIYDGKIINTIQKCVSKDLKVGGLQNL